MKVLDFETTRFVMIPRSLVEDQDITYRDKCVYMSLMMYTNNSTKTSRPSTQTLSNVVGCSRNSIFDSLKRLEESGYIKRENRSSKKSGSLSNVYYLLDK